MRWWSLACVVLAGCYPDLSGYEVQRPARPPRPGVDAGAPRPGVDAGPPPPGVDAGPPLRGGPCARPTLFVATQSLGDAPAALLRYELQGDAGVVPCGPVEAGGEIPAFPFTVTALDESFAVIGARGAVIAVDPVADRGLWRFDVPGMDPNDAFVLERPGGAGAVAAVAWSRTGESSTGRGIIRQLDAFSRGGERVASWSGSELGLGASVAMTAGSRAPGRALALNPNVFNAAEVDPWGEGRRTPEVLPPFSNTAFSSLSEGRRPAGRAVFVYTGLVEGEPQITLFRDPYAGFEDSGAAGRCEMDLCRPVHAVLDPSLDEGVLAVCHDAGVYQVMRYDLGAGRCQEIAGPSNLGSLRPWYLAVLP